MAHSRLRSLERATCWVIRRAMSAKYLALLKKKYHVNITKNLRYKVSAVPFLQRLLNKDTLAKKENLKSIINYEKVSKKPERSEIKDSRVNYICKVDVIT